MTREDAQTKAHGLLVDSAVSILEVGPGHVLAEVVGDHRTYVVDYDGRWRCGCPADGPALARDRDRSGRPDRGPMRNLLPVQCSTPGCARKATTGPRCQVHRVSRWPSSDDYGRGWRTVRDAHIREHPVCEWPGCSAPAEEVDHVVRVKVDPGRRLDPANLRSLCRHHHRARTGRDGARAKAGGR